MIRLRHILSGIAVVVATSQALPAQYGELTRRLPSSTNTIVLLNVEQAHQSPLGVKENWREDHEQQFSSGLVIVPPQSRRFVMAAQIDFATMNPKWQAAMMELSYEPQLTKTAARLNGSVDMLGGREVAVLPGDIAVIKMGPKWAGLRQPADRQEVSRWLNGMDQGTTGKLSEYMAASVKFAEGGAPLIMAIDLKDMTSANEIRPILDELESIKEYNVDKDELAKVLASIEGVSLGVSIGEKRYGKIKVDFAEDATIMAPFAKNLLLEILGRRGLMIDEFAIWKIGGSKNQITLEGTLMESGSRRLLSILDAPPALHQQAHEASQVDPDSPEQQKKVMALATKQYFDSITSLTEDLRLKKSEGEMVTWGQVGGWWEKYSRKIDQLPTLNVDPEMLEFGSWVASAMLDAANALKGIGPNGRLRQMEVPQQYNVRTESRPVAVTRFRAYSWNDYTVTADNRRTGQIQSKIRTQERIRGNMSANSTAQGIQASIGDMRRHMTQKYQIQF
mgnify:CR=1 FL=1